MFNPILGEMIQIDEQFSNGLVQPPTRQAFSKRENMRRMRIDVVLLFLMERCGELLRIRLGKNVSNLFLVLHDFVV